MLLREERDGQAEDAVATGQKCGRNLGPKDRIADGNLKPAPTLARSLACAIRVCSSYDETCEMRGGLSLSLEAGGRGRLILNLRYGAAKSWILGTRAERSRGIEWG